MKKRRTEKALPGFKPSEPVVFCGLFPVDSAEFEDLRDAIEKLALNDASFQLRDGNICGAGLWLSLWVPRAVAP